MLSEEIKFFVCFIRNYVSSNYLLSKTRNLFHQYSQTEQISQRKKEKSLNKHPKFAHNKFYFNDG